MDIKSTAGHDSVPAKHGENLAELLQHWLQELDKGSVRSALVDARGALAASPHRAMADALQRIRRPIKGDGVEALERWRRDGQQGVAALLRHVEKASNASDRLGEHHIRDKPLQYGAHEPGIASRTQKTIDDGPARKMARQWAEQAQRARECDALKRREVAALEKIAAQGVQALQAGTDKVPENAPRLLTRKRVVHLLEASCPTIEAKLNERSRPDHWLQGVSISDGRRVWWDFAALVSGLRDRGDLVSTPLPVDHIGQDEGAPTTTVNQYLRKVHSR